MKLDCIYTFPKDLAANGIPFGPKSMPTQRMPNASELVRSISKIFYTLLIMYYFKYMLINQNIFAMNLIGQRS